MEVFVSWRGSDREIKNNIVETLHQSLGPEIQIWESDEHCLSNFSADCIEAIRHCEVFIVIISQASMEPSYVINEVIEARGLEMRGKLNMVVYRVTDVEYTPEFAANLNHISDVNHVARKAGDDSGVMALARRVQYLLTRRKNHDPEKPYDVYLPEIEGTSISPSGYFVENSRDDIFEQIDAAFARSNVLITTQMSGYGRRSAVRKYLQLHADAFQKVITFPFFEGTLHEFFCRGLVITNINQKVFEDLDDQHLIMKKAELLRKLDAGTVLLVPNVEFGGQTDRLIFDLLAGMECRFIFVTQQALPRMGEIYPVISVGRMQDQYLTDLFFHCYGEPFEGRSPELISALTEFFDSVDGHTKTIELAAMTLADEYGIYQEDIPGILAKIGQKSEDSLAVRITNMISELFDVKTFNPLQQRILQVAALLARIPMDEREFVGVLKECGCYDAQGMRELGASRWLDLDRTGRTVGIEQFLSRVCLAKIEREEEVTAACLSYMEKTFSEDMTRMRLGALPVTFRRARRLFEILHQEKLVQIMSLLEEQVLGGSPAIKLSAGEQLIRDAEKEIALLPKGLCQEKAGEILNTSGGLFRSLLLLDNLDNRPELSSLESTALSGMVGELFDTLYDLQEIDWDEEEEAVISFLYMLMESAMKGDLRRFIKEFLEIADYYTDYTPEENYLLDLCGIILYQIGIQIAQLNNQNHYLCLQLCRACLKMTSSLGELYNEGTAFYLFNNYYHALIGLGEDSEELDQVYESMLAVIKETRGAVFKKNEGPGAEQSIHIAYLGVKLRNDRIEEADRVIRQIFSLKAENLQMLCNRAQAAETFVNGCIQKGESETARIFLTEISLQQDLQKLQDHGSDSQAQEAAASLEVLEEIRAALNEVQKPDFTDESDRYLDYYRTYPDKGADRRKMRLYESIAREAMQLDLTGLTDEQLCQRAIALRSKGPGSRWDKIAPEAFALASEAGFRVLGYRHHMVQLIGAAAIYEGQIAQIQNGEGKTYTIVAAAFLHIVTGRKVSVLDWSEYLTRRNYIWMRGVFEMLGCRAGILVKQYGFSREELRQEPFDVVYATVVSRIFRTCHQELHAIREEKDKYAVIIDEADQAMISYGNVPVMVNDPRGSRDYRRIIEMAGELVKWLRPEDKDLFTLEEKRVTLHAGIYEELERVCRVSVSQMSPEDIAELENALQIGIVVMFGMKKDQDYYIRDGRLLFEDKYSGRFYEADQIFTYFISLKENMTSLQRDLQFKKNKHLNQYGVREFLQSFRYLSGLTATAVDMREEFEKFYGLQVFPVPTNRPVIREDHEPVVFAKTVEKWQYIYRVIAQKHQSGQPVLVITASIPESEQISAILKRAQIEHVLLNAKNVDSEAEMLGNAGLYGRITITTALANRGVDICLGGNPAEAARQHLLRNGVDRVRLEAAVSGLAAGDGKIEKLRKEYENLTAIYRRTMQPKKEIIEGLGGLCVIGTTCFEDLRTEQQMRGRSGRQGSPGESYVFYSMEDPTFRVLLGDTAKTMNRLVGAGTGAMQSGLLVRSIKKARLRLQHARYRRLQEMPEILYYKEARETILTDKNLSLDRMDQYLLRYFSNADICSQYEDYLKTRKAMRLQPLFLQRVSEETLTDLAGLPRRRLPDALLQAHRENMAKYSNMSERVYKDLEFRFILEELVEAWAEYLSRMESEIASASHVFGDEKRQKRHLAAFSKEQAEIVRNNAIREGLYKCTFFTIRNS